MPSWKPARNCSSNGGYNACSVQDITGGGGCSERVVLQLHFKSKEALAAEIRTEYGKGTTDRSILTNPEVPGLTRLKKHFTALNEYFSRCTDGCLVRKIHGRGIERHTADSRGAPKGAARLVRANFVSDSGRTGTGFHS